MRSLLELPTTFALKFSFFGAGLTDVAEGVKTRPLAPPACDKDDGLSAILAWFPIAVGVKDPAKESC